MAKALLRNVMIAAALAGAAMLPGGCAKEVIVHGQQVDEAMLAKIRPGTSVETVLTELGTPTTTSTVGNKTFYYISQTRERKVQFLNPTITDQRVAAIYFDRNFRVERVALYGLKDGEVFDFVTRTTPTSGQERSFVRQMFKGLGASNMNPFAT
ncbi:outer membrane protein assembly factor BamE [Camelimonas abortus]|uniref:Outer membrane protein assembly factor BamE n=1 Tax=Camelimonas abortus TaxID=1017184 RepID=A0ABV7LDE6_9HYPH